MLVDVIRLRLRGIKLPPAQLGPTVRGVLRMRYWTCSGTSGEPAGLIRETLLMRDGADHPPYSGILLPSLSMAEVTRLQEGSMVIVGQETVGERAERTKYAQAWWCRVVR